jgi:general secretion pathway protein C
MNRTAFWIANGALTVLCCYLAAGILAEVVAAAATPPPLSAAAGAPPPASPDRNWSSREVILQRNLFNVSTLSPTETEPEVEDLAATKLPLRLLGTAAAFDPSLSWAAVEDLESRSHQVVKVRDRLSGRAEVVRIERKRIVLRNGGKLEELALDEEAQIVAKPSARSAARGPGSRTAARTRSVTRSDTAADRVKRLAENRFEVDRGDVEDVADNPATLFSQARILPKYEEGAMVGVQLNAIKAGSLFEEIGIKNGDVITQFNGIQITSQQDSAQVLRELTQASEFAVSVRGADGEERQLTYEMR